MNEVRRGLLKLISSSLLLANTGVASAFANSTPLNRSLIENKALLRELLVVYRAWKNTYSQEPLTHLQVLMTSIDSSPFKIDQFIKNDFCEGRMLEVNGLMLSKTEAALLATLYLNS